MKHLKTFLAAVLALALLSGICACAEELPYMEQLSQNKYYGTMLLATEDYPEICISPYYFSSMYISQYDQPYFAHFPCPPDTLVAEFDEGSGSFINMDYGRQYFYGMRESAAFETFVNEAEKDEYILAEGAEGVAIYIEPSEARANALIAVKEIDKNVKLQVRIYDSSLENKSEQQIIESLSAQITEEVARIQASLHVDLMENYWTQGRFAGFKQICQMDNVDGLIMTYTLPEGYFITEMNYGNFSIAKIDGDGNSLVAAISLDTYSYVDYQLEENPKDVSTVQIGGEEYRIYASWYEDQKIMSAYVDRTVAENVGYSADEQLRLTIQLDPEGVHEWESLDALEADLADVVSNVQLDFGQNIPDYREVKAYTYEPVADAGAPSGDEAWICADCGSENHGGKFCPNCGSPRPAQPLVCANCGYQVPEGETPKFCANCGNPF